MKKTNSSRATWTCLQTGYWYVMLSLPCSPQHALTLCLSQGSDTSLYKPALDQIKEFIKTSTSSMTAVPKPLKFLRPHYESLEKAYASWPAGENKVR